MSDNACPAPNTYEMDEKATDTEIQPETLECPSYSVANSSESTDSACVVDSKKSISEANPDVAVVIHEKDKASVENNEVHTTTPTPTPNTLETRCINWIIAHKKILKTIFLISLLLGYCAFLLAACIINFERARILFILTMVVLGVFIVSRIFPHVSPYLWSHIFNPMGAFYDKHVKYMRWVLILGLLGIMVLFLAIDQPIVPERFASMGGLMVYILLCYVFSKHRQQIRWRPVIWGIVLQFIMGLLILRTHVGYSIFNFLGDLITRFLRFTDAGSEFVFGEGFREHLFAFSVLPLVIFFSAIITFLYSIGVMQAVIKVLARGMQATMQTSPTESLNAAGNIFVGQTEAPLLVRPFLKKMTKSELHAVMTGGFATIAGGVLGAYVGMGVPATHLLTASFMSAPAALAIAKLVYPETEKKVEDFGNDIDLEPTKDANFFEALANGASNGIPLVANIAANLIVYIAILDFLDGVLGYCGGLVDFPELSFRLICSYLFTPLALLLGIEINDAFKVGLLLAEKTVANEFVAYDTLSEWISLREAGKPVISVRSEVIAAYALCGFANFTSIGIQIGGLSPMAPERKSELASIAFRALCSGTVACFMTACLAGMFYNPDIAAADGVFNATIAILNATVAPTG